MPVTVAGPDGQRYEFPDGTAPEVMKSAMAKRYPKKADDNPKLGDLIPGSVTPDNPIGDTYAYEDKYRSSGLPPRTYNEIVADSFKPDNLLKSAGAAVSGLNNMMTLGADDEIASFIGEKTGFEPLKQYEATQDRLRAEEPGMFSGSQMAAGFTPMGVARMISAPKTILGSAAQAGTINAGVGLAHGHNDADGEGQNRLVAAGQNAAISGGMGLVFGGGVGALTKILNNKATRDALLEAVPADSIRPQSIDAIRRLLVESGLSSDDIGRLTKEVRRRSDALVGQPASAESRKRLFQHYIEILSENPKSQLYNPQAATNVLMTVQERANSAIPKDGSRGIAGAAIADDRASQVPFLQNSADKLAEGTRVGAKQQAQEIKTELGSRYEEVLNRPASPENREAAMQAVASARPLLDGPSGLKVQAAAENLDLDQLIAANPLKALHWIQAAARRKSKSTDPNAMAFGALRTRLLPIIENAIPEYRQLRRDYATNGGLEDAITFGDRLFGGAQSNVMNNPGMRTELVEQFQALTPKEKQLALVSIRDQAVGKLQGSIEGAPARLSQLNTEAALDFLEQVGAKSFADDVRAIARENQLLSVADSGNPLRQSATFSNAQARAEAPPLYESALANMVNNSTPGTIVGEGALMAFAPHYQGLYAAYRGSRLAAKMGFGTRPQTLEGMTKYLMSRRPDVRTNALAPSDPSLPPSNINALEGITPASEPLPTGSPMTDIVRNGGGGNAAGVIGGLTAVSVGASLPRENGEPGRSPPSRPIDALMEIEAHNRTERAAAPYRGVEGNALGEAGAEGRDLFTQATLARRNQLEAAGNALQAYDPQEELMGGVDSELIRWQEMARAYQAKVAADEMTLEEAANALDHHLRRVGVDPRQNPFRSSE